MSPPGKTEQHPGTYSQPRIGDLMYGMYNTTPEQKQEIAQFRIRQRMAIQAHNLALDAYKFDRSTAAHANNQPITPPSSASSSSPTSMSAFYGPKFDQFVINRKSKNSEEPMSPGPVPDLVPVPVPAVPHKRLRIINRNTAAVTKRDHPPRMKPRIRLITTAERAARPRTPQEETRALLIWSHQVCQRAEKHLTPRLRLITTAERAARPRTPQEEYHALLISSHQVCQRAEKHLAARHAADKTPGSDSD